MDIEIFHDGASGYGAMYSLMALVNVLHYFGLLTSTAAVTSASVSLAVPFMIARAETVWRAVAAVASIYYFSRLYEVVTNGSHFAEVPLVFRLLHVQGSFHHVDTYRCKPRLKSRTEFVAFIPNLMGAALGLLVSQHLSDSKSSIIRTLAVAGHIYSALQMFGSVLSVLFVVFARI